LSYHKVKQGEHLAQIASDYGFGDYLSIWNLSENKELRELRGNPNILFPGDQVFIPDRQIQTKDGTTETRHRFRRDSTRLILRLVIRNVDRKPLSNTSCDLVVNLITNSLVTDDSGMIEHAIPVKVDQASLDIPDINVEFDLNIGYLDPVDEVSGQRERLNNMGYFAGYSQDDTTQLTWAVEEFQCNNKLKVTGTVDEKTKAKLVEVHGC
jgi:hypothetical protein